LIVLKPIKANPLGICIIDLLRFLSVKEAVETFMIIDFVDLEVVIVLVHIQREFRQSREGKLVGQIQEEVGLVMALLDFDFLPLIRRIFFQKIPPRRVCSTIMIDEEVVRLLQPVSENLAAEDKLPWGCMFGWLLINDNDLILAEALLVDKEAKCCDFATLKILIVATFHPFIVFIKS